MDLTCWYCSGVYVPAAFFTSSTYPLDHIPVPKNFRLNDAKNDAYRDLLQSCLRSTVPVR